MEEYLETRLDIPEEWVVHLKTADINSVMNRSKSFNNTTAVRYACRIGDLSLLKILLSLGARIVKDDCIYICQDGHTDLFDYLTENKVPAMMKCLNINLCHMCSDYKSQTQIVKKLLDAGADPNNRSNDFYSTPLSLAVYSGEEDIVHILYGYGAQINAKDSFGRTPLFFVRNSSMCEVLFNLGANPNHRDNEGESALIFILKSNRDKKDFIEVFFNNRTNKCQTRQEWNQGQHYNDNFLKYFTN